MTPGDPKPRGGVLCERHQWPFEVLRTVEFDTASAGESSVAFYDVLTRRRSRRDIGALPASAVAAVVRQAFAIQGQGAGRRRKRMMSAGALHPLACVFFRTGRDVIRYDDDTDAFVQLRVKDEDVMELLVGRCREVLPNSDGYWVLLLADRDLTTQSYENADSLIWRDAGAALQTLALISEAQGLAFCPLGILGQEGAGALLGRGDRFRAVGIAALGRRLDQIASES
jgi:hypothetical protein